MDGAHVIESLAFELEYASEEQAFQRQERLAGFARGRGLQVIAEVFDEMSPPGEVLRLDRLELDLGEVRDDDLEYDLARRLREALRLALSDGLVRAREVPLAPSGQSWWEPSGAVPPPFDTLRANGSGDAAAGAHEPHPHGPRPASVHPRTHAWRQALLHFLHHGHLPWHADKHLAANPAAVLHILLQEDRQAFAAALRALPAASPAWRRVAGLTPAPLRPTLTHLLAPTAGPWLQDLAAALGSLDPAPQRWREQAWAALLPALAAPGNTETLQPRLRELLRPMLAAAVDEEGVHHAALAALGEPPLPPQDEDTPTTAQRSFWRARLDAALQAGSLDGSADTWRALLRHDRRWLRARLAALGRSARMRRVIAQGLDPGLLHELVGLCAGPGMQGAIAALVHSLQRLAADAVAGGQGGMARIAAPVLWEHSLGLLWLDPGPEGEPAGHSGSDAASGSTPVSGEHRPVRPELVEGPGANAPKASARPARTGSDEEPSQPPLTLPTLPVRPEPVEGPDRRTQACAEALLRRLSQDEDIAPEAWAPAATPPRRGDFRAAAERVLQFMRAPAPPASSLKAPSTETRLHLWRKLLLAALTAPPGAAAHPLDPRSLEGLLRQDPTWLRATLSRLGRATHVRRRIAQALDPALLRDLLGLWVAPARQDAIAAFVHGLASLARRQPALARLTAPGLWAHVLGQLWLEEQNPSPQQPAGDEQALARSVLQQLANEGEVALTAWPALMEPGQLDAAVPWVLAQLSHLPQARQPRVPDQAPQAPVTPDQPHDQAPAAATPSRQAPPPEPGTTARDPRIRAWRRLLLATLAPATAEPAPPPLDARSWEGLLRHDAAWLRATVQRLGRSAAVRRRIAQGLGAALLRDLIGLWVVPARQDFIAAFVQGLDRLARRQPALSGIAAAGLWEHTLTYLWLERKAAPEDAVHDEQAFVQSVLRQLSRHGEVAPAAWQALLGPTADLEAAVPWVLAQVGAGVEAAPPAANRLPGAMPPSSGPGDPPPHANADPGADADAGAPHGTPAPARALRAWRRALRAMLAPEAESPWDAAAWEGLLRHDAAWLRAKVPRLGRFAEVRQRIARSLSPDLLRELAGLWVGPARRDVIAGFVQGLDALAHGTPALAGVAAPGVLWGHALGQLWLEPGPGGAEGERDFVRGVLGQLARHEGVDAAVWGSLGGVEAAAAWVLGQVGGEAASRAAGDAAWHGPQARRSRLAEGVSAGCFEGDFERLWLESAREDGLWLRALVSQGGGEAEGLGGTRARGQARAVDGGQSVEVTGALVPLPDPTAAHPEPAFPIALSPPKGTPAHTDTDPARRQAQGERGAWSEQTEDATAPLRQALAQRLPQPRWLQSLAPWLPPGACQELADSIRHLAQAADPHEPQPAPLEPWLWNRALAHLWRLPPQRLDLHALTRQLAHDLAQRTTGHPASAEQGQGTPRSPSAAPVAPQALPPSPLPPMQEWESAAQALLSQLQSRAPLPPADAAQWRAHWATATAHPAPHWRHRLHQALETPPAASRLVELLPRADLVATLRLLRPTEHDDWQATATLITQASRAAGTPGAPGQLESLAWQFIFREAIEEGRPFHTPAHRAGFAHRFVADLARHLTPPDPARWQRALVQALARGSDTLADALRTSLPAPPPPAPVDPPLWDGGPVLDWDDLAEGEAIHVANAGLVLAGPYLPRLLRLLGLAGATAFTPPEAAAERGAHLLQAVVDGRGDTAEPLLVLNKLLCGLPPATPVPPRIELTPQELAAIDGMLKAMIQHWRTLGHTSVAGLRETFLQREGRLLRKNDAWHLVVERRPLDVLLDRLPWGFATLKYPWMEQVLHVQWS